MEYTVKKLAQLAGVSARTLRYYDEIGILKPARVSEAGYRIYEEAQVNRLQQIMFYRELGFPLETIRNILQSPDFDELEALKQHRAQLLDEQERISALIHNVNRTIAMKEGKETMTDMEKFEGFKKQLVANNEQAYGEEIREKYGDDAVEKANQKVLNMTKEEHEALETLTAEVKQTLAAAFQTGDPGSALAQQAAELHKQWLTFYWSDYSKEAHANLVNMYVEDERFRAYYDEEQPGTAEFLREAVHIYTGIKSQG
jgi:DNA-binding transcriptional MerR regulator